MLNWAICPLGPNWRRACTSHPSIPPAARVRARLARLGGPCHQVIPEVELLLVHRRGDPSEGGSVADPQAPMLAERCHAGQMRKSGDPYITHPLAVT